VSTDRWAPADYSRLLLSVTWGLCVAIYTEKSLSSEIVNAIIKSTSTLVEQDVPSVKSLNFEGSSYQKL